MRSLIINSLDFLVWLMAGLVAIAGLVAGGMALANGQVQGLAIMIGAVLYAIIFAGMFFIVIGIHENTKRTAAAVERLSGVK